MSELSLTRLDALLMLVLDEQASKQEHQELLALADAEPRLAEQRALRESLRAALVDAALDPIDVVPQVQASLVPQYSRTEPRPDKLAKTKKMLGIK